MSAEVLTTTSVGQAVIAVCENLLRRTRVYDGKRSGRECASAQLEATPCSRREKTRCPPA